MAPLLVTSTFLPLVEAQAKARRVTPHVVVVPHPVGGLNEEELAAKIETASTDLLAMADALRDRS